MRLGSTLMLLVVLCGPPAAAQDSILRDALVIEPVGRSGRVPFSPDAIQAAIADGTFKAPAAGDTVTLADGSTKTWNPASPDDKGWLRGPSMAGAYVFTTVRSEKDRTAILDAQGHGMVYVNGEPRAGDPYSAGYVHLPVALRAGDNTLLFQVARGQLHAELQEAKSLQFIDTADATTPDIVGGDNDLVGGIVIVNASGSPAENLVIYSTTGLSQTVMTPVPRIEACSARKVRVALRGPSILPAGEVPVQLELATTTSATPIDTASLSLRVRASGQTRKRTFVSDIDGSVQYYAVVPAAGAKATDSGRALVLSLHGADVEATSQADAYSPKPWCDIVCPTNRRRFGFDWEDWGRLDALEVLADAARTLKPDPSRVYLTGHSMGGHGSWSMACLFPGRFAAVGPSAGWISFASYSGAGKFKDDDAVEQMLRRAASPADPLLFLKNLAPLGISILHGDADDNVPVKQARDMKARLDEFHKDTIYHEQPGAGHWWESSDEPGAECLDWPPTFDLFARRRIPAPAQTREVSFTTVNPGISATMGWLTIEQQVRALEPSTASIRMDPGKRRFVGTTNNVAALSLDCSVLPAGGGVSIDLDGTKLDNLKAAQEGTGSRLLLVRTGEQWAASEALPPGSKTPARNGPFRDGFRNLAVLVYPTGGTPEENAWGLAKARFDAETFYVRGNGAFELQPDAAILATPDQFKSRNIILYGNADCNRAWASLLGGSPVQVTRTKVTIGGRETVGDNLACLFLRPREGTDSAVVAAVSGTGLAGLHATTRLPYFTSGIHYPDCTLFSPRIFTDGPGGVLAAGFFGNDWSVDRGDFAWR